MNTQQSRPTRIPEIRFRVLIIGRANAGKTTILQRVCDTTGSPIVYRGGKEVTLDPSMERGEHSIDDELVFSNHKGFVFHDSRGIESGGTEELGILQAFIQRKCGERRLRDRLHAIWYCVPMDNHRPQLDLKFYDICPDRNVPVIVVFTKYDQFLRNVKIHLEDSGRRDDNVSDAADNQFEEHYLRPLGDGVKFVRLEKMHTQHMGCDNLIETTAAALHDDTVGLMLLAVQRGNLELSVKTALNRIRSLTGMEINDIVRECLVSFPYIWLRPEYSLQSPPYESYDESVQVQRRYYSSRSSFLQHVMSLPTVQNLTGYHLIFAVILIFKHATFLRLENVSSESALTQAELDYREANIDLKIQEHLAGSSQDSVELSASFIMATDIVHVQGKEHWFKRLFKPAFPRKS